MRFFFLVILLLSSRAANSGPLNFGESTLSEPDDFSLLDGGKTAGAGKVLELPLDSSQSNQLDAFSNQEADVLPDPRIPGSTNDASPNILADLPVAACSDSDGRVKGSAQKNENLCPANLETPPPKQSTEEGRHQQQNSGNKPEPDGKKDDQNVMNPIPSDNICTPPKKLFCCFGREIENWNSRKGCEACMPPF